MTTNDSIMVTFAAEAAERLQTLTESVMAWERAPSDPAPLASIMRELHTIKGAARMVGCEAIGTLAHEWETFCEPFRQGGRRPTAETFTRLLGGVDALKAAVAAATQPSTGSSLRKRRRLRQEGFVRLPVWRVEQLTGLASEVTLESGHSDQWIGAVRSLRHRLSMIRRRLGWLSANRVMGLPRQLSGLLAGYTLDLEQVDRDLGNVVEGARIGTWRLNRVATDLYGVVGQMRLVPLEAVTAELPRVVRDLAASQGKDVSVVIEGATIGVDRGVLEVVREALGHLVRNAVTHGIEPPADRRAAGKLPRGVVAVRAAARGSTVTIQIEDDGRGIDTTRVVERAVALGLVAEDAAAALSEDDRAGLIFKPGLTTADRVTASAGRGVGLDVVQTAVVRCGGSVRVTSSAGRGTTFILQMPASLALRTLLVGRWDGRHVAVPLSYVRYCRTLTAEEAAAAEARGAVSDGQGRLPIGTIGVMGDGCAAAGVHERTVRQPPEVSSSGVPARGLPRQAAAERSALVAVRCYGTDIGLLWDAVTGVEELVVQGLAEAAQIPGVESVALRPSGDVVQVVDVAALVKQRGGHGR